jgi:phosphotriesterase-related protein
MSVEESSSNVVQTVTGGIDRSAVGLALPHEHLFIDMKNYFVEPEDPAFRDHAFGPITLNNLRWVRYNHLSSRDNLVLNDEDLTISELSLFKKFGGKTIVDATPINLGRNPEGLRSLSEKTGVNIVMGTGYYIEQSYTPDMQMDERSESKIAQTLIEDIVHGADGTAVRAGVIGELGCSWPLTENERKVLRGAALAQQETGVAITIHPGHDESAPFEIMQVLTKAGADPTRVIMGHLELTIPIGSRTTRAKLAETGCYLQFDQMGISELQMYLYRSWLPGMPYMDIANDGIRMNEIRELIEAGFLDRILISSDVCLKTCLAAYGGPGYAHIPEVSIPMMHDKGFPETEIRKITEENPAKALAIVA